MSLSEAGVAGDLVQAIERVRESAEFGGILSSFARRTFSDGRDVETETMERGTLEANLLLESGRDRSSRQRLCVKGIVG